MIRKVGVSIPFGNQERDDKIRQVALNNGFEIEFYEYGKITVEQLDSCEVFFGMAKPEIIKQIKNLKWIHASFAGVDKLVDIPNIKDGSIILTNSSGAFGITISEHVIAVLLMLMRRMTEYYDLQNKHEWKMIGQIKSIMNSTITVVGLGDIGQNVAKRLKAMGAKIIGVRKKINLKPEFVDEIYPSDKLIEAIKGADAVVLCLPQTEETKNILGKNEIEAMKSDALLINIGRGTAIDQDELLKALNDVKIGGAALDVFTHEPLPLNNPLWNAKNTIITPHVSGNMSLPLTCDIAVDLFCKNLENYAKKENLEHVVDVKKGY